MFEVVEYPLDLARLVVAVGRADAGAIATFLGTTRDHNAGRQVIRLEYEAYPEMAIREMQRIGKQTLERFGAKAVAIAHRVGVVEIGEASVAIAVSAAHRDAAFAGCRFAIDRLKEIVPIWKKEYYVGGDTWIGPQHGGPSDSISLA
jgi:molybdopterin synthase catalytic subunit